MDKVYKKLISKVDPKHIIFIGISAGGGFALGFAQKLKYDGLPQPAQIILDSPWLDITCNNSEMRDLEKYDTVLDVDLLKIAGKYYTKGGDTDSYMVCPVNGPIENLGKISVFVGTYDILWADVKKLKSRCDEKGVAINLYVYPLDVSEFT